MPPPMSPDLNDIILYGHYITSFKYYGVATGTILFYDYLLTLKDEIKYAWSGRKSWAFWLFVFNRYFPMTYQFWQTALLFGPQSQLSAKVCDKTAWYAIFTFVVSTFLAQVMLTVRIYAVTMKKNVIAFGFAVLAASQFGLGLCMMILAARKGAQPIPPIPLEAYRICGPMRHRTLEIVYTTFSLVQDFLAFSLIMFLAARSMTPGLKAPTMLKTIAQDAVRFFLVVFASHFVLAMTLIFGQEGIQLLPGPGSIVYLSVMVSRLMLSLRKATDPQQGGWSLAKPVTNDRYFQGIKFPGLRRGVNEREGDIPLDTYQGPRQVNW